MTQEIKVAKILTRTGLKASLPQPLSPGEIGTALDTQEVFIGLNPDNTAANNSLPIINCYASVVDSQTYANQLISTYLFQVNLTNSSITNTDIEAANDDNVTAGFTRRYIKVGTRLYITYEYKYTSSVLDIPVMPNTGLGTEALLSVATGTSFVDNTFDLSLLGTYTWSDTSAIASLMNFAFTPANGIKSGLVNVVQNLKILTAHDILPQAIVAPLGQTIPPASSANYVLSGALVESDNTHYTVDVIVSSVNQTSGDANLSQFKMLVTKVTGPATINFIDMYYSSPASVIDSIGTPDLLVSATVSADGGTITVTITSTAANPHVCVVTSKVQ